MLTSTIDIVATNENAGSDQRLRTWRSTARPCRGTGRELLP
ncbi:hypothetical protein OVN18_09045 [Microcella daejeonensis]|uniref:Uncharacterized protein n=1 Tax=Microcella daejeonensis TaxID=2994971 RepID=A0A9E8MJJ3_9MICO|nr:hypothetical protein [Microcella daejeonensis]WAB80712.1 hypothetical protein OVN18_09045 [Microcella daejeonensis]